MKFTPREDLNMSTPTGITTKDLINAFNRANRLPLSIVDVPEVQAALAESIAALAKLETAAAVQDALRRISANEEAIERARVELDILRGNK